MEQEKNCCCTHRTKERTPEEYKSLINRLSRIEGQIRGIRKDGGEQYVFVPDILVQSAAVTAAMNAFNKELLSDHIRTCVAHDIREGDKETADASIDELLRVIQKLMK